MKTIFSRARARSETNLTRFYRRLAETKPGQVAVMATARKMLKVIYWMLRARAGKASTFY